MIFFSHKIILAKFSYGIICEQTDSRDQNKMHKKNAVFKLYAFLELQFINRSMFDTAILFPNIDKPNIFYECILSSVLQVHCGGG